MTLVSVVVCTKNEEHMVEGCLQALQAQTAKPEIIIVDAHSKDRTVRIAKKYTDRIFYESGVGLGAARDIGVQHAAGDIVAFCDADGRPKENWVETITKLVKGDIVALSGPLQAYDGPWHLRANLTFWADWMPQFLSWFGFHNIWGANMAFRKRVLIRHKFKYRFLEDFYMGEQLRNAKLRYLFSGELVMPISTRRFSEGFYEVCIGHYISHVLTEKLTGKRSTGYY